MPAACCSSAIAQLGDWQRRLSFWVPPQHWHATPGAPPPLTPAAADAWPHRPARSCPRRWPCAARRSTSAAAWCGRRPSTSASCASARSPTRAAAPSSSGACARRRVRGMSAAADARAVAWGQPQLSGAQPSCGERGSSGGGPAAARQMALWAAADGAEQAGGGQPRRLLGDGGTGRQRHAVAAHTAWREASSTLATAAQLRQRGVWPGAAASSCGAWRGRGSQQPRRQAGHWRMPGCLHAVLHAATALPALTCLRSRPPPAAGRPAASCGAPSAA